TDAEQALAAARAERARAAAALSIETAGAESARADWETFGTGEATPLALHEPQVALAVAALEAADARVAQAETALARCEILAPFDGRCVVRLAVPGAVVTPGASLARLESTENVEARVVLRLADLITLGIPMDGAVTPLPAILDPGLGNGAEWLAQLVRIEAAVDPRDRTVGALFRLNAGSEGAGAPLSGLFVRARIQGPELADVVLLPRSARQVDGRVWIVDAENRLRLATALVVAEIEEGLLLRGIADGARICLTPLNIAVAGMPVEPREAR
ncbi:MAG: hypothetical protein O3A20_09065, partial [Planctomycetota bacterium]|nr:hypothetical protein [Planctomycetota bacterium]